MANKTPFINKDNAMNAFDESNKWLRPYFEPIEEQERIARNKPSSKIPNGLPKVTDGTVASIIQESPKRILQQEPTGLFECMDYPQYAKIADIINRDKLMPMSAKNGTYLQKAWNMLGKAMTNGKSTSYTFFTNRNGVFYTDFVIPYIKDVITEKGKVFGPDSNIRFMRSWYQKRDLQAILDFEKKKQSENKDYKSEWDLKMLSDFIESGASAKPADLQTAAEREKGDGFSGGYEVIHAFQNGIGAEFYSFAPRFENGAPMRVKVNSDPRGLMPLDDLYCNIDLSNPLGRGVVEISGGIQNLMDQQLQMFQYMMALIAAPPIQVWGGSKKTFKLAPNAVWDMTNNPNAKVEPYKPLTEPVTSFVANSQFLQSKLYNLNNSQDTSIPAATGTSGQSKTQAGVNAQQERLGVSDNYLRKQGETWVAAQCETGANIYFSEMKGKEELTLDATDLKEFAKTPAAKFVKGNKLTIPYSEMKNVSFKFNFNPDSSQVKEDNETVEKLTAVLDLAKQTPNPEVQNKIPQLFKMVVKEIGAEGTDDLFPEDQTDAEGNTVGAPQQQPQMTPEMVMQIVQETVMPIVEEMKKTQKPQETPEERMIKALNIKFGDLPADTQKSLLNSLEMPTELQMPTERKLDLETLTAVTNAEPNTDSMQELTGLMTSAPNDAEQMFIEELLQRDYNENDIEQAIVMMRRGLDEQEIMQVLGAKAE